jgi:nucleotide-binding universal stress UspA family protein
MHKRDYGVLLARHREAIYPRPGGVKVIAAATDFTPAATAAVRRAAQLARAHGARIALLHVVTPVGRMVTTVLDVLGASNRSGAGSALSQLRQTAARIITEFGVPVDTHLASGHPPRAIAALAQAVQADVVVLGSSKSNFFVDLLGINTARRVRRRTSIPVLAVSRPVQRPYRCVLLAADLSAEAAHAGRVARRLFPAAALIVLHAFESPYEGLLTFADVGPDVVDDYRDRAGHEATERLRLFARDAGFSEDAILEVRHGPPAACIRKRVRELDADVVVLRPAESWLARGMANSVTEQLLAHPPCDALLVR